MMIRRNGKANNVQLNMAAFFHLLLILPWVQNNDF